MQKILLDFVNVEMMFHARALEMYTGCFQSLTTMSEEEDLEEFRNSLRPPTAQSRLEMQRATSKNSLNAGSVGRRTPSGTPQGARRAHQVPNGEGLSTMNTTGTRSMYSESYQVCHNFVYFTHCNVYQFNLIQFDEHQNRLVAGSFNFLVL